ncbi:MAG: CusA/CzcA family heavy metal efflux RND transporter [Flavobacteriales bacterium]|nr:efflux RND transporter permease subunit [Bacteroidales bacterium AH-315-I05]PCJ87079.1 MAG: CusA/CzcA family heavy metal efflux RND transporter [Flavobacteriales bacterium]
MNQLIKFSLNNRLIIMALAVILMVFGTYTAIELPVDVLPDLNRPRVTIFLEAEGMAPEEVEALVVYPVETALNGATDVEQVRSNSSIGLGLVYVEFDYGIDIYKARQIVNEKLQALQDQLPRGVTPKLGPISSVMGQIMLIGITADPKIIETGTTSMAELRTLADYNIRRRLLAIPGIAQVIPIGGEVLQFQVQVSMPKLNASGLSINQVQEALQKSNANTTGNFFKQGGTEILIRNLGRIKTIEQIENIVIGYRAMSGGHRASLRDEGGVPILLSQVAEVRFGAKFKRGDGGLNGEPAVLLTVEKQPHANTLTLTEEVLKAIDELKPALPADVNINTEIFRQSDFIDNSIGNVTEALRDGAILVIIVLFLFLLNFRTTLITLTAIPLSLIITVLVFKLFGITFNTMTLGGIAIAIGELVDDAIVDVENVFRRLRENKQSENPQPTMKVVYNASSEVRNSIVYATVIVVLVFIPLFALSGIEGRIFAPLGVAYITSILASLLIALTITPVMCYYLLPKMKRMSSQEDSFLVRWLKKQDTRLLNFGLSHPKKILVGTGVLLLMALAITPFFGTEFLPPFNEGSLTINYSTPPGTSLDESNKVGSIIEKQLLKIDGVRFTARRTGRAEMDEHSELPTNTDLEVAYDSETHSQAEIVASVRERLNFIPGISINIGQPISHRLDHLLSGVRAQIAIKIFGNDLMELRKYAQQVKTTIGKVKGVVDVQVEKQQLIPQLRITPREEALRYYGLQRGEVVEDLEVFYQGKTVSQILDNEKRFDLVLRLPDDERNDKEAIGRALLETPSGQLVPVSEIADIYMEPGPNTINHENTQRRIIVSCNVTDRDLGSAVKEIQAEIREQVPMPQGYFVSYGGQFESQQAASRLILFLSIFSLAGIFLALYSYFKSPRIVIQIMLNIPLALIGSIIAVWLTGGVFSVASLVGFITLAGIASRNGIMMISHYIHLVEHEGEQFDRKMIIRGSLERLVPVMMTALTAIFALVPLVLVKDAPGKEILYPVAAVIIGGLISSTLLDMIVTPVVFHLFGEKALTRYFERKNQEMMNYK